MNIGIVSNLYPPIARGGAELVARRIAHELHVRGHQLFVFSTRPYSGPKSTVAQVSERSVEAIYRLFPINIYHTLSDFKYPLPKCSIL